MKTPLIVAALWIMLALSCLFVPPPIEYAIANTVTVFNMDGHGSGVVLSGYPNKVITAAHVAVMDDMYVKDFYGNVYSVVSAAIHQQYDIAILTLDRSTYLMGLPVGEYSVGDTVYSIGTPFDLELYQIISKGIVSGDRYISGLGEVIVTDATTNPGNSGGPLINGRCEVVGIVVAGTGGGINFAIPIKHAGE